MRTNITDRQSAAGSAPVARIAGRILHTVGTPCLFVNMFRGRTECDHRNAFIK
jgi:hypothetical protein